LHASWLRRSRRSCPSLTGPTKLARHAAGAHGVCTIPPDVPVNGFDWGDKAARNIEHFMNARQIPVSEHPDLQAALASLRSSRAAG
jgi:hypothetical protein